MPPPATLPFLCLVRHADTAWSASGRYTGLTDAPLTPAGERAALRLRARLRGHDVGAPYTSPLSRALRTCELAGFGASARRDDDLLEWNYGAYEGLTSAEIRAKRPHWQLFRDGAALGEMPLDVVLRAQRVLARFRAGGTSAILFSSGHLLRVLAVTWLGLDVTMAEHLLLGPASISLLGYNHELGTPAIALWNDRDEFPSSGASLPASSGDIPVLDRRVTRS
jgi:probable phosphoglycerate mutase